MATSEAEPRGRRHALSRTCDSHTTQMDAPLRKRDRPLPDGTLVAAEGEEVAEGRAGVGKSCRSRPGRPSAGLGKSFQAHRASDRSEFIQSKEQR